MERNTLTVDLPGCSGFVEYLIDKTSIIVLSYSLECAEEFEYSLEFVVGHYFSAEYELKVVNKANIWE